MAYNALHCVTTFEDKPSFNDNCPWHRHWKTWVALVIVESVSSPEISPSIADTDEGTRKVALPRGLCRIS